MEVQTGVAPAPWVAPSTAAFFRRRTAGCRARSPHRPLSSEFPSRSAIIYPGLPRATSKRRPNRRSAGFSPGLARELAKGGCLRGRGYREPGPACDLRKAHGNQTTTARMSRVAGPSYPGRNRNYFGMNGVFGQRRWFLDGSSRKPGQPTSPRVVDATGKQFYRSLWVKWMISVPTLSFDFGIPTNRRPTISATQRAACTLMKRRRETEASRATPRESIWNRIRNSPASRRSPPWRAMQV